MRSAFVNDDETVKKELSDGRWISVITRLAYVKWVQLYKVLGDLEKFQVQFLMATVKGWNFEDREGHVADITEENIRKLDAILVAEMMTGITELIKLPLEEMRSIGSSILPSKPGAAQ